MITIIIYQCSSSYCNFAFHGSPCLNIKVSGPQKLSDRILILGKLIEFLLQKKMKGECDFYEQYEVECQYSKEKICERSNKCGKKLGHAISFQGDLLYWQKFLQQCRWRIFSKLSLIECHFPQPFFLSVFVLS